MEGVEDMGLREVGAGCDGRGSVEGLLREGASWRVGNGFAEHGQ